MYLELSQGETTAGADAAVVPDGSASHDRSELVDGAGGHGSSLGLTGVPSRDLLAGLYFNSNVRSSSLTTYAMPSQPCFSRVRPPLPHAVPRVNCRGWECPSIVCVPGRSGIEPDAASPFGSLKSIPVSISVALASNPESVLVVKSRDRDRGKVGELTVLDDSLVVLDRLHFNMSRSAVSSLQTNSSIKGLVYLTILSELRSTTGRGLSGNVVSSKTSLPESAKLTEVEKLEVCVMADQSAAGAPGPLSVAWPGRCTCSGWSQIVPAGTSWCSPSTQKRL